MSPNKRQRSEGDAQQHEGGEAEAYADDIQPANGDQQAQQQQREQGQEQEQQDWNGHGPTADVASSPGAHGAGAPAQDSEGDQDGSSRWLHDIVASLCFQGHHDKTNRSSGRLPLLIPAKQTLESHTWAERATTGAVDACASTAGDLLSMGPERNCLQAQLRQAGPPHDCSDWAIRQPSCWCALGDL